MKSVSTVRGTRDILPSEVGFWQEIEWMSKDIFARYQFQEIRTPIFESTELFQESIGSDTDIVSKEMYTFTDKGDRSLTLRPEGTAAIARSYVQQALDKQSQVAKWYYSGPMFRYERPQAGRFRQFHQIGSEHIGTKDPAADAELISLAVHLFEELGIPDLSVKINSVGCPVCRPVIEERIKQFLAPNLKNLCTDCNTRYDQNTLRILDCKKEGCKMYFTGLPDIRSSLCQDCTDHFEVVLEYLDAQGVDFQIDQLLVRGLDYYTKTAFEVVSNKLGAQNAVCGGGRYDHLIERVGGKSIPAVGFAFGVERTVMLIKDLVHTRQAPVDIYLIPMGHTQRKKCFVLQSELRKAGFSVLLGLDDSLKKQFKKASQAGAKFAFVYGEEEAASGKGVLKDLDKREQEEIPLKQLMNTLKERCDDK